MSEENHKTELRYPKEWVQDLKILAKRKHISFNTLMVQMIEKELIDNKFLSHHG